MYKLRKFMNEVWFRYGDGSMTSFVTAIQIAAYQTQRTELELILTLAIKNRALKVIAATDKALDAGALCMLASALSEENTLDINLPYYLLAWQARVKACGKLTGTPGFNFPVSLFRYCRPLFLSEIFMHVDNTLGRHSATQADEFDMKILLATLDERLGLEYSPETYYQTDLTRRALISAILELSVKNRSLS